MTIHIREFKMEDPRTMAAVRTIGGMELADVRGNRLCTYGEPGNARPCFQDASPDPASTRPPLTIAQVCSWALSYPGMKPYQTHPEAHCLCCCPKNAGNCLGSTPAGPSCIFSYCTSRVLHPQFVLLGKNWSEEIVNHQVVSTRWGNGNDLQAKHLRGTIFEGSYFTDFVKGCTATDFGDMARWLMESDPNFNRRRRFDVYLEIFQKELSLLRDNFDLSGTDRYIIVWGNGILNGLNRVAQHCYHCDFSELDCFSGYEIRLFGSHYRSCGGILRKIPLPNREEKTIRRIYRSPQKRTADSRDDRHRFDFEILRNRTVLSQQVVFL